MSLKTHRRLVASLGALAFALAVAALSFWLLRPGPEDAGPRRGAAVPGHWLTAVEPKPPAPFGFTDVSGKTMTLADFKGKVVLLNLWATWCAPCVREMPSLDRLQARLGGAGFQVVALAQDRGGAAVVVPFLEKLGVHALTPYLDQPGASGPAVAAAGLPTTILLDRNGREVARMLGAAAWESAEALSPIDGLLASGR